jgi:uncharacterized membrane-anchored protein
MAQARMAVSAEALSRVPQVTVLFWITKVLTTGTGEDMSDYLVHRFDPIVAVALGGAAFAIAMALQLTSPRFSVWRYWLAVLMVAVFGTMAADGLHVELGVPYVASTAFYAAVLAVIFVVWHRAEGTLSIHSIRNRRRELFYWATVLTTFALGTAAGDMTATTLHLGFFVSGLVFTAVIAIPAVAWWRFGMNAVLAFWFAYVLTRPVGASFADWLGVSHARGGLDLGTGSISLILLALIAVLVALMTARREGDDLAVTQPA